MFCHGNYPAYGAFMLVVDGANVVGSRPDGWWRDRAGAAARLAAGLVSAVAAGHIDAPVVLVLEGAARAGVAEGRRDGVEVVHAPGEGDGVVAALAGPGTVVVSADRDLRRRVEAAGGALRSPLWLLEAIGA